MKLTTLLITAMLTSPVAAGGPVIAIEDTAEAAPAPKLSPGQKIAIAAGLLFIIGLASGGGSDVCNDETPAPTPEPC